MGDLDKFLKAAFGVGQSDHFPDDDDWAFEDEDDLWGDLDDEDYDNDCPCCGWGEDDEEEDEY